MLGGITGYLIFLEKIRTCMYYQVKPAAFVNGILLRILEELLPSASLTIFGL